MVSKKLGEEEVKGMFSQFGPIEDCTVLRDDNGISRGKLKLIIIDSDFLYSSKITFLSSIFIVILYIISASSSSNIKGNPKTKGFV